MKHKPQLLIKLRNFDVVQNSFIYFIDKIFFQINVFKTN